MPDYSSLATLINSRSFDSVWYWVLLVLFWAFQSSTVLGLRKDVVRAAEAGDEEAWQMIDAGLRRQPGIGGLEEMLTGALLGLFLGTSLVLWTLFRAEGAAAAVWIIGPGMGIWALNRWALRLLVRSDQDRETQLRIFRRCELVVWAILVPSLMGTTFTALTWRFG